MEQKDPMELGLRTLENLKVVRNNEFRFISSEFGFVNSFRKMEATLFSIGQPYRIQEGRIIFVNQGSARVLINLIEYTIRQTHFSVITPNSIVQIIEISPDFDMQMMAMNQDFLPISGKEDFFSYLLHHQKKYLIAIVSTRGTANGILFYLDVEYTARTDIPQRSYPPSSGQSSLLYRIYRPKQHADEPCPADTAGRHFPTFHLPCECLQQERAERQLLRRQAMPHPTLPEHRRQASQPTNSNGLDKPVHYTRSQNIAKTWQPACLSDFR